MNPYQQTDTYTQGAYDQDARRQSSSGLGSAASHHPSPPPLQHPLPTHPPVSIPEAGTGTTPPTMYAQPPYATGGHAHAPPPGYGAPQPHQVPHSGYAGYPARQQQQPGTSGNIQDAFAFQDFGAATQFSMQFGRTAMLAGNDYMQKNIQRFVPLSSLKYYFNVSNSYVVKKIGLLLFPFRHKPWSRLARRSEDSGQMEGYKPPREDINAPDMYIPAMALVTYVLMVGVTIGRESKFHPELLGSTTSTALAIVFFEVLFLKFGCYLLNITTEVQLLDLIAYCGYKFVGVIFTLLVKLIVPYSGKWIAFSYTAMAIGFFLLRSLRCVVLPDAASTSSTVLNPQRRRRIHFLFAIAALQLVSMWILLI